MAFKVGCDNFSSSNFSTQVVCSPSGAALFCFEVLFSSTTGSSVDSESLERLFDGVAILLLLILLSLSNYYSIQLSNSYVLKYRVYTIKSHLIAKANIEKKKKKKKKKQIKNFQFG
uniref:Putative uncharacterized membrane protein YMR290W-A n=1 Tax=Saccharomyces cerevisiae (strain ATCC 204508 / S288c) TaxID=559292 RepID=YM290_YEAST|nr:RecName: Full=Putative uncharacterized membrane protein YMR290W-A [Saccharomyces cerevisiae S288C]AHX39336.1 hypothetical protein YMR290W-A [Saccharomyces cerevisiae]